MISCSFRQRWRNSLSTLSARVTRTLQQCDFQCQWSSSWNDEPWSWRQWIQVVQYEQKTFMSSPARAEGYDTPVHQREDSTTFMIPWPVWDLGAAHSLRAQEIGQAFQVNTTNAFNSVERLRDSLRLWVSLPGRRLCQLAVSPFHYLSLSVRISGSLRTLPGLTEPAGVTVPTTPSCKLPTASTWVHRRPGPGRPCPDRGPLSLSYARGSLGSPLEWQWLGHHGVPTHPMMTVT